VFKVHHLQGLTRTSDLYVVVEVDSYGHYFKKSKTKMICNTIEPVWDEEFVIELEGSENLRILVYEQQPNSPATVLRGRATLELSRSDFPLRPLRRMPSIYYLSNGPTWAPLLGIHVVRLPKKSVIVCCSLKGLVKETLVLGSKKSVRARQHGSGVRTQD